MFAIKKFNRFLNSPQPDHFSDIFKTCECDVRTDLKRLKRYTPTLINNQSLFVREKQTNKISLQIFGHTQFVLSGINVVFYLFNREAFLPFGVRPSRKLNSYKNKNSTH